MKRASRLRASSTCWPSIRRRGGSCRRSVARAPGCGTSRRRACSSSRGSPAVSYWRRTGRSRRCAGNDRGGHGASSAVCKFASFGESPGSSPRRASIRAVGISASRRIPRGCASRRSCGPSMVISGRRFRRASCARRPRSTRSEPCACRSSAIRASRRASPSHSNASS